MARWGSRSPRTHPMSTPSPPRLVAAAGWRAAGGPGILGACPGVAAVVAPLGGGGLLAGIAAAVGEIKPGTRLYAAEPETAAPLAASLAAGRPVHFDGWTASFVDGA